MLGQSILQYHLKKIGIASSACSWAIRGLANFSVCVCQDKTLEGWRPRRYACQKSTWLQFLMFLCLTCRAAAQSAHESAAMLCTRLQHVAIQNLRTGYRLNSSLISGEPSTAPKSQAYRKGIRDTNDLE